MKMAVVSMEMPSGHFPVPAACRNRDSCPPDLGFAMMAALEGMYKGHKKGCTVILEAVATHDLWIWHSFFGMPGSNNDINVLQCSPIFSKLVEGHAPPVDFVINGRHYNKGYYLADGIYPKWATFVKTISSPVLPKEVEFVKEQEGCRKDVERAFGVLRFPALTWFKDQMWELDKKLDVKLDMELAMKLDTKTSHGSAREETEACARGEEEVQAAARPGQTGRHAGAPGPRSGPTGRLAGSARRRPDATLVPAGHYPESHAGGLMGHFGREKMLLMLADHFYWPKMRRDVDRYVKRCITCNKSKSKLKPHELCPFEVVYGFKPITPLDLLPLPIHEKVNMEASKRADFVRKIHVKNKELIEKKGKSNAARMNKKRKEILFKPGDMVWVHFRKDRFPKLRKSKLLPRGAGPYKVIAKINDNAYSIDLPIDEFGVSNSFNVADLTPYDGEDLGASRSTPFEGGGR
ncbi:hypothetical protein QYE76_046707 [Lolium multiflorum]|uniref:Uncharacterized protein n=1 Tax=Lolium multiflorum TaxID=4521 RepID=A0AAD8TQD8_LOLMU|nr:hypothetical protein QYE76_046707 [Lolium multiflorum]